jgi:hypothetical protein
MNIPHAAALNKTKIGTCPHGLPAGACPICSGMGGGGAAARKDIRKNEMSWDECYAVWQQMLKAKDLAKQNKNETLQNQIPVPFTAKLDNIALKIANIVEKLTNFTEKAKQTPTIMSKTLAFAAKIVIPVLNVLKNIPIIAQKIINFVQQKLADISDKLNAIFGELKNSIEEKTSKRLKEAKKKLKSLLEIFTIQDVKNEKELPHGDN